MGGGVRIQSYAQYFTYSIHPLELYIYAFKMQK